jgi:hypothetical protein
MTKTSPELLEVAKPAVARRGDTMPMSNPTFKKLQRRRRRRSSDVLVTVGTLIFVAAVGAAGLYALTRSHAAMGSTAPPTVSQMSSTAGPG